MVRLTTYVTLVLLELLRLSDRLTDFAAVHRRPNITDQIFFGGIPPAIGRARCSTDHLPDDTSFAGYF